MRAIIVALVALVLAPPPTYSQPRPGPDAQQRWAEYQEMMNAFDPILRWEGLNRALADENPGVRNNALWAFLHKLDRLPLEIVLPPGSNLGSGDLPNIEITNIKWNEDQRALEGRVLSFNGSGYPTGQVAGGRLRLRFSQINMPTSLGQKEAAASSKREIAVRSCNVVLSVNQTRDGLEGKFQCEGTSLSLLVQMPLG